MRVGAGSSAVSADARDRRGKSGMTLVEVLIASVILLVIATGAGSYMYGSRRDAGLQRLKRVAVEVANARLELVRGSGYDNVKPTTQSFAAIYLNGTSGTLVRGSSNPNETFSVHGVVLPIVTTVQYVDIDGGSSSYDALKVVVQVGVRLGSSERIRLETFVSP